VKFLFSIGRNGLSGREGIQNAAREKDFPELPGVHGPVVGIN